MVEGGGTFEHGLHIRNTACVEVRDDTIEGGGISEHLIHIRNTARDEVRDVTVEEGGTTEHLIHIRNAACVPVTKIFIEAIPSSTTVRLHNRTSTPSAPQTRHVRHAARIPHANVTVPRFCCRCVTAPKHQLYPQCLIRARDALRVERTRTRSREHPIESRALGNVPAEGLVERRGAVEHVFECRDGGDCGKADMCLCVYG